MSYSTETCRMAEERIASQMAADGSLLEVQAAMSGNMLCSITLEESTTIADVKVQIKLLTGIPLDEQILFSPTSHTHLGDLTRVFKNPVIPGYLTCVRSVQSPVLPMAYESEEELSDYRMRLDSGEGHDIL
mmetsp:Transcript_11557/g.20470  ORF Transcript_11557/g.20470 Transcript_11557/m.20470 type:complete len:131 (+) Transcript_11557:50-442(+)|eukprot:CAMPEP_0197652510 /NCGR_PEP_ID=MMETSP1338-20131121/34496_1 /TAXON_ID=43686 ORGANISM="Pelagodinium beii, Strain RCC1491" /NCGR_SAMPLE_ID=MMETSP1338 /ASSEMBLY_ACC=CAM_ASM_000754 /LENGTH=130 /DNA_ID=CAMNT_0043227403 /DNA_START=47 /DNA_END=442 /DNA_ORIENTATION=+